MSKITIIGAGSLVFSSRLMADILTYEPTRDAHFALVDIDPKRLEFAGKIAERMFKEGGYDKATCSTHADRREALPGSDHVITSLLVGGYPAIEAEIDIPHRYGVDQCIGDTLTPGGIMRCLRTLPAQAGVAQDMAELCPKATLLNYTNPMAMLTWGMYRAAPEINMVGLCHSVQGTTAQWARRLGHDISDINFECAGINHQAWITRFEKDGVDLLPQVREKALDPEIWKGDTSRMEYVKHLGYPVTEGSGHNSEYTPWFRKDPETIKRYCPGGSWNGGSGFIKELYNRPDWADTMQKMADWEKPVKLERSIEYGSQIINAIEGGDPCIIYGNVANKRLIENLPEGSCVELAIHVDKNGLQPIHYGKLPTHLAAINRNQINVQELAVEAAIESDPEKLFQAMTMDPLTATHLTLDQIREMTAELLEAHKPYLPESWKDKSLEKKPVFFADQIGAEAEKHEDPTEERA